MSNNNWYRQVHSEYNTLCKKSSREMNGIYIYIIVHGITIKFYLQLNTLIRENFLTHNVVTYNSVVATPQYCCIRFSTSKES